MRKIIVIFSVIIGVIIFVYTYVYKDHRDIASEAPTFATTALKIHADFSRNSELAQDKYLDKTIGISGIISNIDNKSITLNNKVYCELAELWKGLKLGDTIKLKGRVIGYDELLNELKLDQAYIIN